MMRCEFLVSMKSGQVLAGTVTLDGKTVSQVASPGYESMMSEIVADGVFVDDQRVTATGDPEKWFANLPREYSGSHLRARMVP